jgi:nucleotide-binding universal stress UspA family protein
MIKTILVPANGDESDAVAFGTASGLVRQFNAHVDVLHIRVDPVGVAVGMTVDASGGTLMTGLIESLEHDAAELETKVRDSFHRFCERESLTIAAGPGETAGKPSAQFHVETGREQRWLATYGLVADVIVASRDSGESAGARSALEALVVDTGRPVLIPSAAAPMAAVADTIAIGWKPVPQCARAVAAAMPLLLRAKQIVILTVEEEEDDRRDEAERLVRSLAWHGVAATAERLRPGSQGAAETLFATAKERAGLLVMGGYGHSRLRERVFGGFTQQALAEAPLPVLLAH